MPKTDEKLKKLDEQIARRKAALKRLSPPEGAGAGALTERELRKLLKQAQRRRRTLLLYQKRHEARDEGEKEKGAEQ